MRRYLELIVLVGTAGALIATSQAMEPCASETLYLRAETSCGPTANISVTTSSNCQVSVNGADFAGLPSSGNLRNHVADGGMATAGFNLYGATADGGNVRSCSAQPADGGFTINCTPTCGAAEADAGTCENRCGGNLVPQ